MVVFWQTMDYFGDLAATCGKCKNVKKRQKHKDVIRKLLYIGLCCAAGLPSQSMLRASLKSGNTVLSGVKDDIQGDFQDDFQHQSFKATAWIECFYVER